MTPRPAALLIVAAMLAAGCVVGGAPDAALETARCAVRTAEADPAVSLYALTALENAERELEVAESAPPAGARRGQAAYLAAQNARVALMRAGVAADHVRMAAAQRERERNEFAERLPVYLGE